MECIILSDKPNRFSASIMAVRSNELGFLLAGAHVFVLMARFFAQHLRQLLFQRGDDGLQVFLLLS